MASERRKRARSTYRANCSPGPWLGGQPGRIGAVLSVGLHGQVGNPELGGDAAVLVNPVGEEKLSPFPGELMLRLNDGVEGAGVLVRPGKGGEIEGGVPVLEQGELQLSLSLADGGPPRESPPASAPWKG